MLLGNTIYLAISWVLELTLAILLFRRGVRRYFRLFFFFALFTALATGLKFVVAGNYRSYFYVYWSTEAILLLLGLAALHEVFHWVYEGFYRLLWFQFVYYGAITLVLLVTIRNAIINPPIQAHPVIGLILDVGIVINFIQLAIVAVFSSLLKPLFVPFRRYPFGIVSGFGISAMGTLVSYLARSIFGTKVQTFTQNASAVAYILALVLWIIAFFRQEPEEKAWTPPMPPAEMLRIARAYLKVLRPGRKDDDT